MLHRGREDDEAADRPHRAQPTTSGAAESGSLAPSRSPAAEPAQVGEPDAGPAGPVDGGGPAGPVDGGGPAGTATATATDDPHPDADPDPDPDADPAPAHRRRFRIPRSARFTIMVVVLFFVLEYLLVPEIASARKSIKVLGRVDIPWLILATALEFCALGAYAELTRAVLYPGTPSRFRLLRINMSSLAVSHVVPGGTAPGAAVAYRLLGEAGVPGSTAAFGLATQGVGSAVVLNLIFWFFLLISIPLRGYNPLYGFAAIAGVLLLAAFGGVVLLLVRGQGQAAHYLHRMARRMPFLNPDRILALIQNVADRLKLLLGNRQLLLRAMLWAAANWLLDAASLWVFLLAFGHAVSPVDLLVAYGLANILAVIPITPSGLGVVEGVLIPTLAGFGVPKAITVVGVLAWRLVNFWLPIPVGGIAYFSLRVGPFAKRRHQAAAEKTHPAEGQVA